jgi:hypothetical protein
MMKHPMTAVDRAGLLAAGATARHPKLKAAIFAYARLRQLDVSHEEALIEAAEFADLDTSLFDRWWKQ